jgi:hypothetical protein
LSTQNQSRLYRGLVPIISTPLDDLVLCRQLMQGAIDRGSLHEALLLATSASKLLQACVKAGLKDGSVITEQTLLESADGLIKIINQHCEDHDLDAIATAFYNQSVRERKNNHE